MKPTLIKGNRIVAEWYEPKDDGSPLKHTLHKEVTRAQYHPIDNDEFVRLYFKGDMPAWIKKYAAAKKYTCQETTFKNEKGWWLSNWNQWGKWKPFSAPSMLGAFRQFIKWLPDDLEEEKERLENEQNSIVERMIQHAHDYEDAGMVYRAASVGEGGIVAINTAQLDPTTDVGVESIQNLLRELHLPLPEKVEEDSTDDEFEVDLDTQEKDFFHEESFDLEVEFETEETFIDESYEEKFIILEDEQKEHANQFILIDGNQEEANTKLPCKDEETNLSSGKSNQEVVLKPSKRHNIVQGQLGLF
ncbi:hypothetical protein BpOF4_20649 (plasmid) [Alkalihalophilus pseudofirmus OF4]|uniref:Uncharacterized protein n=1 Tax=Alkalihalophilus pseudofirmus (strain ATCC BAA-2126 / JCM 17055 / OF4) TaxID=398511 RepID=D3G199_ALKPO|nr:hypothetical protein [Alkalihalophilus pseudofirmus]ADC52125.1 hypothetical protein BpOF4_20649 [Alkalihalophilus pseudofirmus OF4]